MIKVSELIDMLTEQISKNINVLECYISIDDRNNVIKFTVPLKELTEARKEVKNETDDNSRRQQRDTTSGER